MQKKKIRLFGTLKVLCSAAILTALAVVTAYLCKMLTITPSIRITFENLPIILSGYLFGPVTGFATGVCADLLNTAVSQYGIGGINPIITLGAGAVGFFAGLPYSKNHKLRLPAAVALSHITGNMIIKSAGLMLYYSLPLAGVLPRLPLYAVIGAVEYLLLYFITKSTALRRAMGGRNDL
ncbi:MAG: folate family ECF transporter S component [Ruminococcaceae bacterium]|nr:folate family ECF transporter S component [Oscillospiraceae bacterium]